MTNYIKDPHTAIFTGHTGCGKCYIVLDLIEKNITNILTTSSLSSQRFDGTRLIILKIQKKRMKIFGLQNLRTGYIKG